MSPAPTLGEVVAVLDGFFDPTTAEEWDAVGLVVGDPAAAVQDVLVAIDPTEDVVAEAVRRGCQLLLTHHPLFLRGVHGVAETTPGGRVVTTLTRAGCALMTAHTNADMARPGVSDALLAVLGVAGEGEALLPGPPLRLDALAVHVPGAHRERVAAALADAGAGRLGDYDRVAWWGSGTGTFRPLPGARPHLGRVGEVEVVAEDRLEVVLPPGTRGAVLAALHRAHPYEEVSHWLWPLEVPSRLGIGRVGELPAAEPLGAFTARVAAALPATAAGVRAAGDPGRSVRRIAVCGGSGGDLAQAARSAGADVLLTADLRHHGALDAVAAAGPALVDVAHWASEWPWCPAVAQRLAAALPAITVGVSTRVTDPWSLHVPSPSERSPARP